MAMRRSFCGSHRERVEAAAALQASRRRRRISLELDEFERPGGRALFEESPEVEAYLAALTVNPSRPRRASIDCPKSAYALEHFPEEDPKAPYTVMAEDVQDDGDLSPESDEGVSVNPTKMADPQIAAIGGQRFAPALSHNSPQSGSRNILASAKKACASLLKRSSKKSSQKAASSQIMTTVQKRNSTEGSAVTSSPAKPAAAGSGAAGPAATSVGPLVLTPFDHNRESHAESRPPPRRGMDSWAGDGNLQEWVDWSVVNDALRPPDLLQAQQALIAGSRGAGELLTGPTER